PKPLLDRMEVISISGYTDVEKFHIVKKYLVSKQMEQHGLKAADIEIPDATIEKLIQNYTREAGVRNLERMVATVCRKVAKRIVEARMEEAKGGKAAKKAAKAIVVSADDLEEMLGPPKYTVGKAEEQSEIGLTNGLAYTEAGGDLLQIEVATVPG